MLASTKKTMNNSTVATNKSSIVKQKETLFFFIFCKVKQALNLIYLFSRKCLWVSSTGNTSIIVGLIVIILPFAFAYFMEMQKELLKIQGGSTNNIMQLDKDRKFTDQFHCSVSFHYSLSILFQFYLFLLPHPHHHTKARLF